MHSSGGDRDGGERSRERSQQSFGGSKADIAAQGYDLSLIRYKEVDASYLSH